MQERRRPPKPKDAHRSEFLHALKTGALIGAVLLMVIIPGLHMVQAPRTSQPPAEFPIAPQPPSASAPAAPAPTHPAPEGSLASPEAAPPATGAPSAALPPAGEDAAVPQSEQQAQAPRSDPGAFPGSGKSEPAAPVQPGPQLRLADFRGEDPSPDARLVANWVVHTANNQRHAFVVVDKKDARVYVFTPDGKLKDSAPALLGAARGDITYPGVGDKPLEAIKPYEKTTPAGRFVAAVGTNGKEDVVWVDYDAAISMHRIRPTVAAERRLERLASLTTDDNRISFGCINLPVTFYENVVKPTVHKLGAVVYVLPEVKTPQQVFGAYDVLQARGGAANAPALASAPDLQQVSTTR